MKNQEENYSSQIMILQGQKEPVRCSGGWGAATWGWTIRPLGELVSSGVPWTIAALTKKQRSI